MTANVRLLLSLLVFAGWVAVTILLPHLWRTVAGPQSLDSVVSQAIQPSIALAIVFLFAAVAVFRWRDVGLNPPRPMRSLRLLWFPAIYVAGFAVAVVVVGVPPAPVTLTILANTAMVGVSEELACRGILYRGLRVRFSLWTAILGSTFLFGAVHVLNGLATGDFALASVQAVAAFMTGIAFMGVRLRTGSLYPVMVLHWLWDFTLVTTVVAVVTRYDITEPASPTTAALALMPILFILPNFLYGLFLLRHATRDEAMAEGRGA
jgi:hypothetical protein